MGLRSRLLEIPIVYEVLTNGLARREANSWLINDVIEIKPDMKVLDVGCGTADILSVLPDVEYLGVDSNPKYIARAKSRFEKRGQFALLDVNDPSAKDLGRFERILVLGVLHHLNDDEIKNLVRSLSKCLAKDGRRVTLDNSIIKGQHPIARFLAKADRGRFSRSPEHYRRLLESSFHVDGEFIRHDLMRTPYSLVAFTARTAAP